MVFRFVLDGWGGDFLISCSLYLLPASIINPVILSCIPNSPEVVAQPKTGNPNIGALIIRIGFGGPYTIIIIRNPTIVLVIVETLL